MKQRQVSIELLRIVAMLMVLTLHANFLGIGVPTSDTVLTADGVIRSLLQSMCVSAVNTFVMISGWFGIRSNVKGFSNFLWQVAYFVGLSYLFFFIVYGYPITFKNLLNCFGLYDGGGWFVSSYIGLYILAPVLNSFLQTSDRRTISLFLLAFFAFEFLWGNTLSVGFIIGGYSTFSFIGVYLLAGLLRKSLVKIDSKSALLLFFICSLVNGILYIAATRLGLVAVTPILFNYINPLVIASAAFLLLGFINMPDINSERISKIILWLGASCFAAYLFHVCTKYSATAYFEVVRELYSNNEGLLNFVRIGMFILAVFFCAVILDLPRKLIWKHWLSPLFIKK